MTKEKQDLSWACLPKEAREEIKREYNHTFGWSWDSVKDAFLENLYGHHNLTSDTEPEEMLMVERKKVQDIYKTSQEILNNESNGSKMYSMHLQIMCVLENLFGDKCIPDKPSVQVEPKLDILPCWGERLIITNKTNDKLAMSIGDKFTVISSWKGTMQSVAHRIYLRIRQDNGYVRVINSDKYSWKPYTETETIDTMEEKELNLAELLKGCEGGEIYSPTFGVVKVSIVNCNCIGVDPWNHNSKSFRTDGRYVDKADAVISLFPSKALYEKYPLDAKKAWQIWAEERKPKRWIPQIGEHIFWVNANLMVSQDRFCDFDAQRKRRAVGNEFKTGKEAQQAAEAVRECLENFHKDHQ